MEEIDDLDLDFSDRFPALVTTNGDDHAFDFTNNGFYEEMSSSMDSVFSSWV